MTRLKPVKNGNNGDLLGWAFRCPGCDHAHVFWVKGPTTWRFDGNMEQPTFSPSLLNTCENHVDPKQRRCHLMLTAGKISYCEDCTHDLAQKTVDLPEWPY